MCSMPTHNRTVSSVTPVAASSDGDNWRCVVDAGWVASDLASPDCSGCAVGQAKSATGSCQEESTDLPSWCPQGFVESGDAVPKCTADIADCATSPFAGVADGPSNWFVDSQTQGEQNGTQAAPFLSLDQALAAAKASGAPQSTIALAAGSHPLSAGPTQIPAGVKILGRCAQLTTLQAANDIAGSTLLLSGALEGVTVSGGEVPVTASGPGLLKRAHLVGGTTAGLLCNGCVVQQVVVSAKNRGIEVEGGVVTLQQVRVQASTDRGVTLAGSATAVFVDVVVSEIKTNSQGKGGYGLLLAEKATATGKGLRIVGAASAGIIALDAGTSGQFSRVSVQGTKAAGGSSEHGPALLASAGAQLQVTHGRFSNSQGVGVLSSGAGSQVRLLNCIVEGTTASKSQGSGDGLRAEDGGLVQIKACLIQGNRTRGILVSGPGAKLVAERVVIRDTLPRASDLKGGYGLWVEDGGSAAVTGGRIQSNRTAGVGVAGQGSSATLQSVEVLATLPSAKDATAGYGVLAAEGAMLQLAGARISGNRAVGLWISDGATATGKNVVVDHTASLADLSQGRGIQVSSGAKLNLSDALVYGNRDLGILVDGAGAALELGTAGGPATVIAAMLPRGYDGGGGRALQVQSGAKAVVTNAHISGARELAVAVTGSKSQLSLSQVWVTETSPRASDLLLGRGIAAEAGAKLTVAGVTILRARDAGLSVAGAEVTGHDLWVDETLPTALAPLGAATWSPIHGRGLELSGKSKVQLQRVRLSRNRDVALALAHTGTSAEFSDLVIDGTTEEPATLEGGGAIQVIGGARLRLKGVRLQNNRDVAVLVTGSGSDLSAQDLSIDQTLPEAAKGTRGLGLAVVGATANLVGALITNQRQHGVYSEHAVLSLIGTVVKGTLPLPNGTAGQGIHTKGGELQCWGCQALGNRGAALVAQLTSVLLERTALLGSQLSPNAQVADLAGDGLLLVDCLEASLHNIVLAANARAGAVLHGGSTLAVGISLIGNKFAWSIQAAAQLVTSAAVVTNNLQNAWTGPALQWFVAPVVLQARPVLGLATVSELGSGIAP